jgi:hypothetical protein
MKVRVLLKGVTGIAGVDRSLEIPMEFPGNTLGELSRSLAGKLDPEAKGTYLSEEGKIKLDVLITVKGIPIWGKDRGDLRLEEGEQVELALVGS